MYPLVIFVSLPPPISTQEAFTIIPSSTSHFPSCKHVATLQHLALRRRCRSQLRLQSQLSKSFSQSSRPRRVNPQGKTECLHHLYHYSMPITKRRIDDFAHTQVNKRNNASPPYSPAALNFTHGVASGDPFSNSVIIWTRCAPIQDQVNDNSTVSGYVPLYNPVPIYSQSETPPPSTAPICVSYKVASDNAFAKVVDSGMAYTSSDVDYTLKVVDFSSVTNNVRTEKIRLKPRISVRTLGIITSSVSATPMSPAQLDGQRRHLHRTTW